MKKPLVFFGFPIIVSISLFAQKKETTHNTVTKPAPYNLKTTIAHGKKVYTQYCLSCHQADGGGVQNMNPPLTGTSYVLGVKDTIIRIVLNGFNQGVEIDGQAYNNRMPSFKNLKDKDIADVLTYIRNSFGNKADAVDPAEVALIRNDLMSPPK